MKDAHEKAIEYATNNGAIISFDPNVRLALWDDIDLLRKRINEFIPRQILLRFLMRNLNLLQEKIALKMLCHSYLQAELN